MIAVKDGVVLYAGKIKLMADGLYGPGFVDHRLNPGNCQLVNTDPPVDWIGGGYRYENGSFVKEAWHEQELEKQKKEKNRRAAKKDRDNLNAANLVVNLGGTDYEFDLDDDAKESVSGLVRLTSAEFEEVRQEFIDNGMTPAAGKIPWVLADNSVLEVSQADVRKINKEASKRKARNHIAYQAAKAAL